jgi:hypothetical protein
VHLDGSESGVFGIKYDGARKVGEIRATSPVPVPWHVGIWSEDGKYTFGNAVVLIIPAAYHDRCVHYLSPLVNVADVLGGMSAWKAAGLATGRVL